MKASDSKGQGSSSCQSSYLCIENQATESRGPQRTDPVPGWNSAPKPLNLNPKHLSIRLCSLGRNCCGVDSASIKTRHAKHVQMFESRVPSAS